MLRTVGQLSEKSSPDVDSFHFYSVVERCPIHLHLHHARILIL